MKVTKPSTLKGTRDLGSVEMIKRNFIFDTIKTVFKKFGFLQIETPSMERLEVLTGKYGEEGDQLLFKILDSGNFLNGSSKPELDELFSNPANKLSEKGLSVLRKTTSEISSKGLRYDLTVPFARYVAMNHSNLAMPFKRFQIQPVWRADKPQKGRYQEFFQCDADVVGTESLLCEAEIILMINEVFASLGIEDYTIKINNRKVLSGLAELLDCKESETDLFVAIDKLDKVPFEKVAIELTNKGFKEDQIALLKEFISCNSITEVNELFDSSELGKQGIGEIEEVKGIISGFGKEIAQLEFDPQLARGLAYYTGCIFEVKVNNVKIGSVSGGGRYNNLTEVFGLKNMPGVGFSFGVDRIFDVMEELNLFPEKTSESTQVLITNFDPECFLQALPILAKLRETGIKAEIYPDNAKMKKQFNYANRKGIPYILIAGSDEFSKNIFGFKNMDSGEQENISLEAIIEKLS